MLASLVAEPFDTPAWIFEPKYDGLRVLGRFDGKRLTLLSRNNQDQSFPFPDVAAALGDSLDRPAVVDGEIVCFDEHGRSSFRSLQQRFHLKDPAEERTRMEQYPAYLYLFDILYLDRYDLTDLPLEERKQILRGAVRWSDRVRWTPFQKGGGPALLRQACHDGEEGIIGKDLRSRYRAGRSAAWVKIKCVGRQEFVIGGFTDPQRSRVGLGALLVGYYSDDGTELHYAGKVGTGYTRETLLDLRERLGKLERPASPFTEGDAPAGEHTHWVRPKLVAEIAFAEWTQHGRLRQPRFEGLRTDKAPQDCKRERPRPATPAPPKEETKMARSQKKTAGVSDPAALSEYRAKRDFGKTPEPGARPGKPHRRPIFVVQEHHASRLHYDFRLEADGVLKSWAVPKEPSLDPAQKRLAVHVEDHPLDYATFEGTIPEGEYGAGTVTVWDHGTYDNLLAEKATPQTVAEGIEAGRLEFKLHGEKLRGRFALIRIKGKGRGKDNWLLIKMKDEHARAAADNGAPARPTPAKAVKASAPKARTRSAAPPEDGVAVTNPDKVWFQGAGITKGEVFAYYQRIADRLLPFLRDRPDTLERLPEGVGGPGKPHFWQKHTPVYYPDWVPRVELPSERGKPVSYVLINDVDTLLYLVNQGTLTFHPWFSRIQDLDRPDYVLFDLDPGEASFADVVAVARRLHAALEEEGAEAAVKTSGKSGLHVLVPWQAQGGYDEARTWAQGVARQVAEALPEQATVEVRKAKREGRVYIDTLQNARGHHAVPPYVVRAVPGATVSTPLTWQELTPELDPGRFNVKTIFRRLARQKEDPMAGLARRFGANW
jgi:bifunctional non-homologous end joining protein LigD